LKELLFGHGFLFLFVECEFDFAGMESDEFIAACLYVVEVVSCHDGGDFFVLHELECECEYLLSH